MPPNSGMAMMLKTLGLDPEEIRANMESFMAGMKAQAEAIDAKLTRIEAKSDRIEAAIAEQGPVKQTAAILEDGETTGVYITNEKFPQVMIDDVNRGTQ
jgi:hypothetical protein